MMTVNVFIGIDPGLSGAVAALAEGSVITMVMPLLEN